LPTIQSSIGKTTQLRYIRAWLISINFDMAVMVQKIMKKIFLVLLLALSGTAIAAQVDEWLQKLEHPRHQKLALLPENLIQNYISYDFSSTLKPRTIFLGYIGDNFRRIHISFKSISRDPKNQDRYLVYGESVVGKNKNEFNGYITVTSVREYKKMHYGVDDELITTGIQHEGLLIGHYKFQEQQSQSHSGIFEGIVTAYWYIDKAGKLRYDDIEAAYSDNYTNNQYVGTWTEHHTEKQEIANWGEHRIPFSGGLDIGAAEFGLNPKYKEQGWEKY